MPIRASSGAVPEWDTLFTLAQGQAGYFTTREAAKYHVGTALLTHHVGIGRLQHVGRGVFRFSNYPPTAHDELVPIWLWSDRQGVFSHETALALHELSDLAPTHVDLTVPKRWAKRRLKLPPGLELHFADVRKSERAPSGAVVSTEVVRTLNDCLEVGVEEQFLAQAVREAVRHGRLIHADADRLAPRLRRFLPRSMRSRS
jgi:predicted transcriptional regulator of viral defense system